MNYYIQGNKDKAQQIKAAFKKKGVDTSDWEFINPCDLYFNVGSKIYTIDYSIKHIITGRLDYTHLELSAEPKFKIGDWIVRSNGSSDIPIQVYGLKKDRYLVTNMLGSKGELMINRQDEWYLWTIQDAKDGDVLVTEDYIFIFKYILHGGVHLYCHYNIDDEEFDSDIPDSIIGNIHDKGAHFHPATKEQRELLFSKMKEAGYQWDAGKKELKKIQPHYGISNFHAGMPVLVRLRDDHKWCYLLFSHCYKHQGILHFQAGGAGWLQCIPFNRNTEHLLGTTDPCGEEFINW